MEINSTSYADKKERVQFINDFRTGKTKVVEKSPNLQNSVKNNSDSNNGILESQNKAGDRGHFHRSEDSVALVTVDSTENSKDIKTETVRTYLKGGQITAGSSPKNKNGNDEKRSESKIQKDVKLEAKIPKYEIKESHTQERRDSEIIFKTYDDGDERVDLKYSDDKMASNSFSMKQNETFDPRFLVNGIVTTDPISTEHTGTYMNGQSPMIKYELKGHHKIDHTSIESEKDYSCKEQSDVSYVQGKDKTELEIQNICPRKDYAFQGHCISGNLSDEETTELSSVEARSCSPISEDSYYLDMADRECRRENGVSHHHSTDRIDILQKKTRTDILTDQESTNQETSETFLRRGNNTENSDRPINNGNKTTDILEGVDDKDHLFLRTKVYEDENKISNKTVVVQSAYSTVDSTTQTLLSFESIQEQFSILCEKCGHTISVHEILLNFLENPLRLVDGHHCTYLEENFIVGEIKHDNSTVNEEDNVVSEVSLMGNESSTSTSFIGHTETKMKLLNNHTNNQIVDFDQTINDEIGKVSHRKDSVFCFRGNRSLDSSKEDTVILHGDNSNQEKESFGNDSSPSRVKSEKDKNNGTPPCHLNSSKLSGFHKDHLNHGSCEQNGTLQQEDDENLLKLGSDSFIGRDIPSSPTEIGDVDKTFDVDALTAVVNANKSSSDLYEETNSNSNKHQERKKVRSKFLPPRISPYEISCQSLKGPTSHKPWCNNPTYKPKRRKEHNPTCHLAKLGNQNSYWYKVDMMDKLSQFAGENHLEMHNVNADGNCMFSAVVDQLWINGVFRFTPESLREDAIKFLRQHPNHKDGSHLESFLDDETWDEYLKRMSRNGEWGDQMILQGVSEVTCFNVIVVNSEMIITRLQPWHSTSDIGPLNVILLGHMGEYHYVSLRQENWQQIWGIKAKLKLLQEIHGTKSLEGVYPKREVTDNDEEHIDVQESRTQKQAEISEDNREIPSNNTNDEIDQSKSETEERDIQLEDKDYLNLAIESANLIEKNTVLKATEELMDKQEDLNRLLRETKFIDPISTVSMEHLSFYLAQVLGPLYIYTNIHIDNINYLASNFAHANFLDAVVYGKAGERLAVIPYHDFYKVPIIKPHVLFYKSNLAEVVHENNDIVVEKSFVVETDACKPGFLRLRVPYPNKFQQCSIINVEGQTYLTDINIELPTIPGNSYVQPKLEKGLECQKWPPVLTAEWRTRDRSSGFPDEQMLVELASRACLLRKSHHPMSALPEAEWQFIFPTVETDLFRDIMSTDMQYVMKLFKIIVDFHTANLPKQLNTNHLKTVMLHCCEKFPLSVWAENIGGALLGLVRYLMLYLKDRFLPHYVMLSVNLLDTFTDEESDALLVSIEQIRLFPFMAVRVLADKYELFNRWIIQPIMTDLHRYRDDKDILRSIEHCFCPTLIEMGRRMVMFGIHHFNSTLDIIKVAYKKVRFVEQERKLDILKPFDQYIEPFLYAVDDPITRYLFTDYVDKQIGTSVLINMTAADQVRTISEITERQNGGEYNEFPIPDGSKLDDVEYLNKMTEYLEWTKKYDTAAHFVRCGIGFVRKCMSTEIIDGSEISEEDIKTQVSVQNARTIKHLQTNLYKLYDRLIYCYDYMGQKELFQEYIHEFEEFVEASCSSCYYRKLSNLYQEFGNEEKAGLFLKRSEEMKREIHSTLI